MHDEDEGDTVNLVSILKCGAGLDAVDNRNNNAIMLACSSGNRNFVKFFADNYSKILRT